MGSTIRDGLTDLYRFFDPDDRLLYVGISFSAVARASSHRAEKPWWPDVARMEVEHYPTRAEALAAESAAIRTENPIHNVIGRQQAATKRAPWRCEGCKRPIGLSKQDGHIQVHRGDDDWHCVCLKCDDKATPRYWIDAHRIQTVEDIEHWTDHLSGKRWFEQSTWVHMVRRCSTHQGASTRAYPAFDAHRDRMRRHMMRLDAS